MTHECSSKAFTAYEGGTFQMSIRMDNLDIEADLGVLRRIYDDSRNGEVTITVRFRGNDRPTIPAAATRLRALLEDAGFFME